MAAKEIIGATTEHWMDKRLREHKPINCEGNLIRMSAAVLLMLHNEKMRLLGQHQTLSEASEEAAQTMASET